MNKKTIIRFIRSSESELNDKKFNEVRRGSLRIKAYEVKCKDIVSGIIDDSNDILSVMEGDEVQASSVNRGSSILVSTAYSLINAEIFRNVFEMSNGISKLRRECRSLRVYLLIKRMFNSRVHREITAAAIERRVVELIESSVDEDTDLDSINRKFKYWRLEKI